MSRYLDGKRKALTNTQRPPERTPCKLPTCERPQYTQSLCRRHHEARGVLAPITRDEAAQADEMAQRFEYSLEESRRAAQQEAS